ncbi:hypothetical protein GALMADRAFT_848896 [Galerina marginata CBS 339.88]|uniref:DUF6533 domain-containing protein n=1 Tax=Galerina marginata (strain CBS 339.88) TaxID=685588 RepID=A0A067TKC4_GALM3|nr:hypothetical protein GALMADRAFT_848896 [Galerina marginata CBS 339.88]
MDSPSTQAAAAAALLQGLLEAGLIGPFVTYFDVAASALFVYDYLLTFQLEVELIWKSRWNFIKVLFIIQRYMPFIDTCFLTVWRQLGYLTLTQCEKVPFITGFFFMAGFALSEALLSLRVWALWDRNKWLSVVLPILFMVIWAPSFYTMYLYVNSLRYTISPLPSAKGCIVVAAKEYVIWSWVGLLGWNSVTLFLTLLHGWRTYRSGIVSRLASVIYRDGAYYYIYLFCACPNVERMFIGAESLGCSIVFSILNILFTLTLPPAKRVVVLSPERCMHSMFASRVLLHMRAQARPPSPDNNWSSAAGGTFETGGVHLRTAGSAKAQQSDIGQFVHVATLDYQMTDFEKV